MKEIETNRRVCIHVGPVCYDECRSDGLDSDSQGVEKAPLDGVTNGGGAVSEKLQEDSVSGLDTRCPRGTAPGWVQHEGGWGAREVRVGEGQQAGMEGSRGTRLFGTRIHEMG